MGATREEWFRESCKLIIEQGGSCSGIVCEYCPGDSTGDSSGCLWSANGWSCDHVLASAERWLLNHPELEELSALRAENERLREDIADVVCQIPRITAALLDRAERVGNPDYYNGIINRLAALAVSGGEE